MSDLAKRSMLCMQCPGCFSVTIAKDLRPEGWQECECGEKLSVIDLRDTFGTEGWYADRRDLQLAPVRCVASWLGEQCELMGNHEGSHRVESKANPGLFHRWLSVGGETKEPQ